MKDLQQCRAELDAVDQEIVRLFEKRMTISRDVASYKIANYMPVLDQSREEQVLASRAGMAQDPYWAEDVRQLYKAIMAISREEQHRLLKRAGEE